MKHGESSSGALSAAGSAPAEIAQGATRTRALRRGGSSIVAKRSASAAMALLLGMAALSLGGCGYHSKNTAAPPVSEPPPMDTLLLSDLLRFYLDGDRETERGLSDCYGGGCVQTDGERILNKVPEFYVFAGHHDDYFSVPENTIENRNGITVGDISLGTKDLPDLPDFASERTIRGYGGWGEYHGFDALYFGFLREDREQEVVEASLGGYASEGNPVGGPLTWTGAAVAVDYSTIRNEEDREKEDRFLVGDSELAVYLNEGYTEYLGRDQYLISVAITDLKDVESGRAYADMIWRNIQLLDGGFENFDIKGRFFGPNHEEVGGVFERDKIVGAFGATREEGPESN